LFDTEEAGEPMETLLKRSSWNDRWVVTLALNVDDDLLDRHCLLNMLIKPMIRILILLCNIDCADLDSGLHPKLLSFIRYSGYIGVPFVC
jgi:hypothetical protein